MTAEIDPRDYAFTLAALLRVREEIAVMERCGAIGAVLIRDAALRPRAVGSSARSPALPDVPTVAESGDPGFEATLWLLVRAPAGTLKAIFGQLESELRAIVAMLDSARRARNGADRSPPRRQSSRNSSAMMSWRYALSGARITDRSQLERRTFDDALCDRRSRGRMRCRQRGAR